jgi:hypothetical protein
MDQRTLGPAMIDSIISHAHGALIRNLQRVDRFQQRCGFRQGCE